MAWGQRQRKVTELQKDPDLKAGSREGMPKELGTLNSSKCQSAPGLRAPRGP